jgi:hypothetical protein
MHLMRTLANPLLQPAPHLRFRVAAVCLLLLAATAGCSIGLPGQSSNTLQAIGGKTTIACLPPAHPSSLGGCVAEDAATGISLRVASAYADAAATAVQLETTNTSNYPLLLIYQPQLALQSGHVLQTGSGYSGTSALLLSEPLPPDDFTSRVRLVATSHFMGSVLNGPPPPSPPPAPPWLKNIRAITVSVPFAITPVRSGGYLYHQAPTVKQGIGVQVLSLQYAPSRTVFYGTAGGASIELRFTGLPADMELLSFLRFQSHVFFESGSESDGSPGLLDLNIPGMGLLTPAFTILQSPAWPNNLPTNSVVPTVGSTGTVEIEVSYQGAGEPTGHNATLSISQIQLLTGGTDAYSGVPTLPAYQIMLPLN